VSVWGKSHGTMWGLVWGGVEIVSITPVDRIYISLGLYRTTTVGLGVTREVVFGVER
jgi:hypothetical protein